MSLSQAETIAVRLEGGLGDHVLGMRVLPFIRQRYPHHTIVGYSDSGGHPAPLAVARMSPLLDRVVPVGRVPVDSDNWGELTGLLPPDLEAMQAAALFVDAWVNRLFVEAACALDVPVFEILAQRPTLTVPHDARQHALRLLDRHSGARFVGLNLLKAGHGHTILLAHEHRLIAFLHELLADPSVVILNMMTSTYDFPHWPMTRRMERQRLAAEEVISLRRYSETHDRIVHCEDLPISTIGGLLASCHYFVGVDNGIKHMAWALGVPHTFFVPDEPDLTRVFRWMPDIHRMLRYDSPPEAFAAHLASAKAALAAPVRRCAVPPRPTIVQMHHLCDARNTTSNPL